MLEQLKETLQARRAELKGPSLMLIIALFFSIIGLIFAAFSDRSGLAFVPGCLLFIGMGGSSLWLFLVCVLPLLFDIRAGKKRLQLWEKIAAETEDKITATAYQDFLKFDEEFAKKEKELKGLEKERQAKIAYIESLAE